MIYTNFEVAPTTLYKREREREREWCVQKVMRLKRETYTERNINFIQNSPPWHLTHTRDIYTYSLKESIMSVCEKDIYEKYKNSRPPPPCQHILG